MVMARQRSFLAELGTWLRKWERRPGWTYYAVCHHPYKCDMLNPNHRCTEVLGYAGQTRRKPQTRWDEHAKGGGAFNLEQQPWSDTIIRWEVARHGKHWSGFKLDRAERKLIIRGVRGLGRPLYNYDWNKLNPDRIKPWEAQEQRKRRDAARARRGVSVTAAMVAASQPRKTNGALVGVRIRRDSQGRVVGSTWYGDRADAFRQDFLSAVRQQSRGRKS
jgi:hypothetical protein